MRLIDADKFKDCFNTDTAIGKTMRLMIDEQPTAYDLDKVVEKIREYADNVAELGGNFLPQVVLEIVKAGGVSDE